MGVPQILVVEDADRLGRVGADLVTDVISATPAASVVVATGRTPMGLYATLASRRDSGVLDTSGITAVQLDEYLGLEPGDRRSLFGWMKRSFLKPLGVSDDRLIRLPLEGDLDAACAAYDREFEAREPLDLAILGLGPNGHLGFNEPPSDPASPTRVVELSVATLEANGRYWDGASVPARAVTLGMRYLLAARTIVLVVSGVSKNAIVHRVLEGAVGPDVPASFLQKAAGDVHVVVDRAAWGGG
jgi:glucosamine-6-phosphate deaminase